jgi:hypothetical protein
LGEVLAHIADIELSLVLLVRLRRAANLLAKLLKGDESLKPAIQAFDGAVPDLRYLRNTQEHFDDYIIGRGRHQPKRGSRRSYLLGRGAPIICRGRRTVDLASAMKAARELYVEVCRVTKGETPHLLDGATEVDPLLDEGRWEVSFSSPYYYWDDEENRPVAGEDLPATNDE